MTDSTIDKNIAHIVSSVFQPLLMPIYGVVLLFTYTHFRIIYASQFMKLALPAILFSFIIPGLLIFFMFRMKLIQDISLKRKNDRFLPYIVTLLSYVFMTYYFYQMGLPSWFLMMIVASIVVMLLAIIITLWWKISAHMFGVGGLTGGVMAVSYLVESVNPYILFMLLFVIAGLTGTSRLLLRRHTPAQVYAGFSLGFLVSCVCIWIGA